MEYTEIQDRGCHNYLEYNDNEYNRLNEAKASCTSNPECGGFEVVDGYMYFPCDELIYSSDGSTGFMKGNSYLEGH